MREILFRGKHSEKSMLWDYGDLYVDHDKVYIVIRETMHGVRVHGEVIPDTVGQFTGLTDKNGKKIFEGDIIAFPDTGEAGYEYKEGYDFVNVATVCFNNCRWELEDFGDENSGVKDDMDNWHEDFIGIFPLSEVIGNIHDNPELMEDECHG
jgi:uncharacterized phage protein (TIGR01671 family)